MQKKTGENSKNDVSTKAFMTERRSLSPLVLTACIWTQWDSWMHCFIPTEVERVCKLADENCFNPDKNLCLFLHFNQWRNIQFRWRWIWAFEKWFLFAFQQLHMMNSYIWSLGRKSFHDFIPVFSFLFWSCPNRRLCQGDLSRTRLHQRFNRKMFSAYES